MNIDVVYKRIPIEGQGVIDFVLRFYEGVFALFIGFSFARIRLLVLKYGLLFGLITPIIVSALAGHSPGQQ
jgi:hypothetical protein